MQYLKENPSFKHIQSKSWRDISKIKPAHQQILAGNYDVAKQKNSK